MTADTVLRRRLAKDLDRAFPEMVTQMQGLVFNGARRWLPNRSDAEDIAQEVFVRAYRALSGYSPERIAELRIRPWLFTITINLCRNHARTRSRRPVEVVLDGHHSSGTTFATEQHAIDALVVDEWRVRLQALAPRQRDAIVLRHVVGLTYKEVGEVLGCPTGTVKSDVHRGLTQLRSILAMEDSP
ncbi:MAG: RNA polymerase sigma factor [Actinomycetota bacterium]|nr:RNA polymerase sigma factor [Actinomycetota bacterium]